MARAVALLAALLALSGCGPVVAIGAAVGVAAGSGGGGGGGSGGGTAVVVPGPAATISFATDPTDVAAGASVAPAVEVIVTDALGNLPDDVPGPVTLALAANPGGATLFGTLAASPSGGVARFADVRLVKAAAGYRLAASLGSLPSTTSRAFAVGPGPAAALAFVAQPGSVTAGASISPAPAVRTFDAFGNTTAAPAAGLGVSIAVNPAGGALGGAQVVAISGGTATFPLLTIDRSGAGYRLAATAPGVAPATCGTFDVAPDAPVALTFLAQPSNVEVRSVMAPPVRVAYEDRFGNRVTNAGGAVAVALSGGAPGAALSGTLSVTPSGGVATFSTLSVDTVAPGYALVASAGGFSVTSRAFAVAAAPASKLALLVEPSATTAGATIAPAVTVATVDSLGVVVSGTAQVSLALGANPGGATLSGGGAVATAGGIATFASLSLERAAAGYTLVATSSGLTSATSAPFDVAAGAPVRLRFVVEPVFAEPGGVIVPPIQVAVEDAPGHGVATPATTVSIALGPSPPAPATLSGTSATATIAGVATFPDLTLDLPGSGYRLVASASGLASATSSAFDVTPAPPPVTFAIVPRSGRTVHEFMPATPAAFTGHTEPAAGFLGTSPPVAAVPTPTSGGGDVAVAYTVSDSESNFVWIDVEYSAGGGPFRPATAAAGSERTFAVASTPGGAAHAFTWDAAGDLGAGTFSVVVRARAAAAEAGPLATTGAFTVTN